MPDDKEDKDEEEDEEDDLSDVPEAEESLPDQFKQMSIYLRASRGSADHFFQVATKLSGLRGPGDGSGEGSTTGGHNNGNGDDDDDDDHTAGLEQTPVFYDPGMLPTRKPAKELSRSIVDVLPPMIDTARNYFNAQHMYIGTIFAFSDPETFEKQLEAAYEGPQAFAGAEDGGGNDTEVCLTYAKIFMILALGRLYSVNRTTASISRNDGKNNTKNDDDKPNSAEADDNDRPPGFGYFAHALALLPDVHEPGSILGVETLAYVGYFLQNMNRRDAAYLYIGLALRMAISLGLHQEAPSSLALSEADREHRRRVWWSIYSLDRILSLKSGHPIAILDEDIGANTPKQLPGEPVDSPVVMLRCYTELSRILGDITTLIYRRTSPPASSTSTSALSPASVAQRAHTGSSLVVTVHAILQSLNQWEEALPRALRLDPDRGSKLSRESISMYLHYYQCINMTARPLLFHVVQKRIAAIRSAAEGSHGEEHAQADLGAAEKERDWQTGLSPKTVAVIHACMSAARNTIQIMSKAADYNMVATYGYMDSEHAFSAAIVLALVYTAFPTNAPTVEAMAKGLALLRRMGDLGNGYVAARYEQLARLRTILGPAASSKGDKGDKRGKGKAKEGVPAKAPLQEDSLQQIPLPPMFPPPTVEHQIPEVVPYHISGQAPEPLQHQGYPGHLYQPRPSEPSMRPGNVLQFQPYAGQLPAQQPHDFDLDLDDAVFFENLNLTAIDASGVLFDPDTAMLVTEDAADNTLWTSAFTNATNFDIGQLMPEADMSDYFTFLDGSGN